MKGLLFQIQHFCLQDGPGIRTTVFFKGCPLHCAWCHNPEAYQKSPELLYAPERCIGCGRCVPACPRSLHLIAAEVHSYHRSGCTACGRCARVCPSGALRLCGSLSTVEEVILEVLEDRVFYENTGGGLTLSGGEPLFQPAFAYALAKQAKEQGLPVCVETCGYGTASSLFALAQHTDLFLFDFKLWDVREHQRYTGVSNRTIHSNLALLAAEGARIILRCPILPSINQTEAHFDRIAALVNRFSPSIEAVQLLLYHPLGLEKAAALGKHMFYTHPGFLDATEVQPLIQQIQPSCPVPIQIL